MKKFKLIKILFLSLTGILFSCEDANDNSSIPDYPVYLERNTNSEAIPLRTIGGVMTFTEYEKSSDALGYGGIMIMYGYKDEYYAYDMACPYEKKRTVRVTPNGVGQAICDECGSVFNIGWGGGYRESGPAEENLKGYTVTKHNTSSGLILTVTQ